MPWHVLECWTLGAQRRAFQNLASLNARTSYHREDVCYFSQLSTRGLVQTTRRPGVAMSAKFKRRLRRAENTLRGLFPSSSTKLFVASPKIYLKYADWDGLEICTSVLIENANVFGPLTSAISKLSRCIAIFEVSTKEAVGLGPLSGANYSNRASTNQNQAGTCEEYNKLGIDINDLLGVLSRYLDVGKSSNIFRDRAAKLARAIDEETEPLRRRKEGTHAERGTKTIVDPSQIMECYRRVRALLVRFMVTESNGIWRNIGEAALDVRLNQLPHSPEAQYHPGESNRAYRHGCAPNTRVDVLKQLHVWAHYRDHQKIYWLNGVAGTGKTTIAYSLCSQLESVGKLAASFFCSRQLPTCRDASCILPSISHQISRLSRPFQCMVSNVIGQDVNVQAMPFSKQLQELVVVPLRKVKHTFPGDMVIVIDALDECEDIDEVGRILDALLLEASDLPVKFFITSRPTPKIVERMGGKQGERSEWELRLHDIHHSTVQNDIRKYLVAELERPDRPVTDIDDLVRQSGVLFLYAAILAGNIRDGSISGGVQRLKQVLATCTSEEADVWYTTILRGALDGSALEDPRRHQMILVLHTVVCAREPLTVDDVADIPGVDSAGLVQHTLRPLWSLLQVPDANGVVTILHESFSNFILDQRRSNEFYCDPQGHYARLALSSFDLIKEPNPPFNICNLESSYLRDREVPNIGARVNKAVSRKLLHACRKWETYLERVTHSEKVLGALHDFLSTRLLLWMEILNLTHHMLEGVEQLRKLHIWLKRTKDTGNIQLLVQDARSFATAFLWSPLPDSTPHIYVSMLPFWQEDRQVSIRYMPRMSGLARARDGGTKLRIPIAQTSYPGTDRMVCVACSPNNSQIAFGLGKTIRVLDSYTGRPIGQPLRGHTGLVASVAYSHDGAYIVSGSEDRTLRIWNARTRLPIGQPLEGHTSLVTSVAYSHNGASIVSGSEDRTLRIWDARTRQPIGKPLEGHRDSVRSVAYSPNGAYIVSGSDDNTIRIWDARTRRPRGQTFNGHADLVWSVAYSPDGACIVSGSWDKTIRIWDAHTGQPIGQPFTGHTDLVCSVVYSPDGAYVMSGSWDKTIRMWDAKTGQPVGQPFKAHTDLVCSVAYLSDGAYIVSGSWDKTIRIWDAHTGQPTSQPLKGHAGSARSTAYSLDNVHTVPGSDDENTPTWDAHTGRHVGQLFEGHRYSVRSVTYSPDGDYVASGSWDRSICIWGARTGQPIGQPLEGRSGSVMSIAYSPDGAYIVSGSDDNTIHIWNAHTGQPVGQPLEGHTDSVRSVVYSPDGGYIASGSWDKSIRVWNSRTGKLVGQALEGHTGSIMSVAYSPNGAHIASGSEDSTVRIWDAHTGHPIGQPLEGHTDWVCSVAYSPNGAYIVSGSDDMTIRIWDTHTGQPAGQPLNGHTDWVCSVAYSPDGAYIVSGSADNTIRIWDAHTGQPVGQPLEGHKSSVMSVAYSPNGASIVSGSDDKTIRVWDTPTGQPLGGHTDSVNSTAHPPTPANNSSMFQVPPNDWTLNEEGWTVSANQNRLIWVPPHARDVLLRPRNRAVISCEGSVGLDFRNAVLGEDWRDLFDPSVAS